MLRQENGIYIDRIIPIAGDRMILVYKGGSHLELYTHAGQKLAELPMFEEVEGKDLFAFASDHDIDSGDMFAVLGFKSVQLPDQRVLVGFRGERVLVISAVDGETLTAFYADSTVQKLEILSADPLTLVVGTQEGTVLFLVYYRHQQERHTPMEALIKDLLLSADSQEIESKLPAVLPPIMNEYPDLELWELISKVLIPQSQRLIEQETNPEQRALMMNNLNFLQAAVRVFSKADMGDVDSLLSAMLIEALEQAPYFDEGEFQPLLNGLPDVSLQTVADELEAHLSELDDDDMIERFETAISYFRRQA